MYHSLLAENLPRVRDTIGSAAELSGRSSDEIALIAVTKGHGYTEYTEEIYEAPL